MNWQSLSPIEVRDYLKTHGWQILEKALQDGLYVMSHPQHARRQLVFPMDQSAPDYVDAISLTIKKFAELHGQNEQLIPALIRNARER